MTKKPASPVSPPPTTRWWDTLSAVLLLAALLTTASRLQSTGWAPDLNIIQFIVLLSGLAGLALGQSRFKPLSAALLATAYGLFVVPWQLGLLHRTETGWVERLRVVVMRADRILDQLAAKETITDSFLFLIAMSALFWVLGVYSGYCITRHADPWKSTLPVGLTLFVIQYYYNCPYYPGSNVCADVNLSLGLMYLVLFLFLALLMIARLFYLRKNWDWRQSHTYISPDVSYDFTRLTVILVMAISIFAWGAPVVKAGPLPEAARLVNMFDRPMRTINEFFQPMFSAIRATVGIAADYYGDQLQLGSGAYLDDTPVLQIEAPVLPAAAGRYYWRARVYALYDRAGWSSQFPETLLLNPNRFDLKLPPDEGRLNFTILFTPYYPISNLFVVSQPQRTDRPVRIEAYANPDGSYDTGGWEATSYIPSGETYEVEAAIALVTEKDLRAAGEVYPTWVTDRYLQLPDTITPRTRSLAQEIAAGLDNPYDITKAVTAFLRQQIEYSTTIDATPEGQEPIDWFLFDYRQGFCNYYASAEVILLRSLGIPARLAVGYAEGERLPDTTVVAPHSKEELEAALNEPDTYVVRQRDSHAWPEVYFPGVGWIEFEPTTAQVEITRPSGETLPSGGPVGEQPEPPAPLRDNLPLLDDMEVEATPEAAASPAPQPFEMTPVHWGGLLLVFILLLAAVAWRGVLLVKLEAGLRRLGIQPPPILNQWAEAAQNTPPLVVRVETGMRQIGLRPPRFLSRWAYMLRLPLLTKSYLEINRALARLGSAPAPEKTPAERASTLVKLLPAAAQPANRLLAEYQQATYSPRPANVQVAHRAGKDIRNLSYLALARKWLRRSQSKPTAPQKKPNP